MIKTGSQILWECLEQQGVTTVFGYPGGAILPAYDALKYSNIHPPYAWPPAHGAPGRDGYCCISAHHRPGGWRRRDNRKQLSPLAAPNTPTEFASLFLSSNFPPKNIRSSSPADLELIPISNAPGQTHPLAALGVSTSIILENRNKWVLTVETSFGDTSTYSERPHTGHSSGGGRIMHHANPESPFPPHLIA